MILDGHISVWNLLIANRASREVVERNGLLMDDTIDGRLSLEQLCRQRGIPVERVIERHQSGDVAA